jgi:hypothetical protein
MALCCVVGLIFNGLKSVVTRCTEPKALRNTQKFRRNESCCSNGFQSVDVGTNNVVATDFNPLM